MKKSGEIRIGFEATGHYCINLKLFLEKNHHSFMELNPLLIKQFVNAQTLRRTKTDSIDCQVIAKYMTTIEYKPYPTGFYHMYSLKSLTRLRDSLIRQRSKYMVQITNVLDHIFPEFKPFFSNRFSATSLYILEKYRTVTAIANMNVKSYEHLHSLSRGHFGMDKFFELKKQELIEKEIFNRNIGSWDVTIKKQENHCYTMAFFVFFYHPFDFFCF